MAKRKPKFIIKEEDGVVVAILQNTSMDLINLLKVDTDDYRVIEKLILSDQYKGVAKLADGDVWDEEVGKDIAFEKAHAKYKEAILKRLKMIKKGIKESLEQMEVIVKDFEENF